MSYKDIFRNCGIQIPQFMIPDSSVDLSKWAIIACDQHSSDASYWKKAEAIVGTDPSTLNLIYPEAYYASEKDKSARIRNIHMQMKSYIDSGVLKTLEPGFIYLERSTPHVSKRRGLLVTIDLEEYEFRPGSNPSIRPTEGTILERIPPRQMVREKAILDFSHVLMLMDDPKDRIFNVLEDRKNQLMKLYETDLMLDGGTLKGYLVNDSDILVTIAEFLSELKNNSEFLFSIGDGNHSLATAKEVWEDMKRKTPDIDPEHPCRYATVELTNIHDEGLIFEPIHRVLFNVDKETLLDNFEKSDCVDSIESFTEIGKADAVWQKSDKNAHTLMSTADSVFIIKFSSESLKGNLLVENLQNILDDFLSIHNETEIDFIHGEKALFALSGNPNAAGFLLSPLEKNEFFALIEKKGTLPRKAFSLGEAEEKRYYLETRKLFL